MINPIPELDQPLLKATQNSVTFPFTFNPCPCCQKSSQDVADYHPTKSKQPQRSIAFKVQSLMGINYYALLNLLFEMYSQCPSYCFYQVMFYFIAILPLLTIAVWITVGTILNIDYVQFAGATVFFQGLVLVILWNYSKSRLVKQFVVVLSDYVYEGQNGSKVIIKAVKTDGPTMKEFWKQDGNANCCYKVIKALYIQKIN